jgi:hypothetical protein
MNVTIRMLGIATSIFWIILFAFIGSAAYSMKDLSFGIGEPQFTTPSSGDLTITLPFYIDNEGYYSLKSFNLTTIFSDSEGYEVSRASTLVGVIPQDQNTTILHNFTLPNHYLFDNANLNCEVIAGLNFAEIVPAQLATNLTFPWSAPLSGFELGQPQFKRVDSSHSEAEVPISFENHSAFDLSGTLRIKLFDEHGTFLGETQMTINLAESPSYSDILDFSVPAISNTYLKGYFEVYFSSSTFDYGPMVIPFG